MIEGKVLTRAESDFRVCREMFQDLPQMAEDAPDDLVGKLRNRGRVTT